jgi:hypothetical protein
MVITEALTSYANQHLMYQAGLWGLLALIPLFIVYLIRPKPKKQTIPALMFLMKESAKSDKSSFLRRFIRDPLFLFQILILVALAIAIAKPFMIVSEDVFVEKTAIVIDASASSQALMNGESRFEREITIAQENLGTKNAIILASSVPELIIDDASAVDAKDDLSSIKPRDTPTNIFDAIIFAGNYVKDKDRVVVISDFIETGTQKDFNAARNILKSKGVLVDLVNIRDQEQPKPKNTGIIDLDVKEELTSVEIKNYNDINETVGVALEGANLTVKEVVIDPKGVEVVSFPTPAALSKFSIRPSPGHDDFPLDNEIFLSAPSNTPVPMLLISNSVTKYLTTALDVIGNVAVDRGVPPKVPDINHQIIMISNINKDLLLPGTMKNIKKKVNDGAALVVVAQDGLTNIDFEGMLPVERAENSGPVLITEDQYIVHSESGTLTEDINFGRVTKYLKVKPVAGTTVLATTTNNVTMLAIKNYGKGMVAYFGLMDDASDFKLDIYYPVFWKRLFDMAIKKQDLSDLNFRTGRLVNLLKTQKITTPYGKITADTLMLSRQGIYRGEEKNFVANLLNEEESNINGEGVDQKIGVFESSFKNREQVPFELTKYFLIGLLIAVFLELLWIKFRGDM